MKRKIMIFTSAMCLFLVMVPPVHGVWNPVTDLVSGFGEGSGVKADVEVEQDSVRGTIEVGVGEADGGSLGFLTKGIKLVTEGPKGLLRRLKRVYKVVKGGGIALLKIVIRVAFRAYFLRYYTQVLKTKVDIKIDEKQEFEIEYDLGFRYGGDVTKGFNAVNAKILMKEDIGADDFTLEPDPVAFFARAEKRVKQSLDTFAPALSFLPGAGPLLNGVKVILGKLKLLMRWRPETVFLIKVFSLINSARAQDDPMQFFDATLQFPVLLCRLARSTNELATIRANGGETNRSKWKKVLLFKDTGILAVFDEGPLAFVQRVLKEMTVKIKAWMYNEWKERKDKKELTSLQVAYSNMRRTQGYLKQTNYFIEEILPLLDKEKLDKTDQEFFVKAIRVHVARRYQGLLKVFKVTGFVGGEEAFTSEKDRLTSELENELALAKEVMLYRGLLPDAKGLSSGLGLMLGKTLDKMKSNAGGNPFVKSHINAVASISAQLLDEGARLKELFDQVVWPAVMPKGIMLDDIGKDEDLLTFLKGFKAPPVRTKDFAFGVSPEVSDEIDESAIPTGEYVGDFEDEF